MLFRFLALVILAGGTFGYYRFYADAETQNTIQAFVLNFTKSTTDRFEKTRASLAEQKEVLQARLIDLQAQASEKAEAGVAKYEEVTNKIQATKEAIEELDRSIKDLKESVGASEKEEEGLE